MRGYAVVCAPKRGLSGPRFLGVVENLRIEQVFLGVESRMFPTRKPRLDRMVRLTVVKSGSGERAWRMLLLLNRIRRSRASTCFEAHTARFNTEPKSKLQRCFHPLPRLDSPQLERH